MTTIHRDISNLVSQADSELCDLGEHDGIQDAIDTLQPLADAAEHGSHYHDGMTDAVNSCVAAFSYSVDYHHDADTVPTVAFDPADLLQALASVRAAFRPSGHAKAIQAVRDARDEADEPPADEPDRDDYEEDDEYADAHREWVEETATATEYARGLDDAAQALIAKFGDPDPSWRPAW